MNNYLDNKRQYIYDLKEEATQLKTIIGQYRKRRPVVIEFSGAPKSGKTSSINSLMQFLKRNDFKVKVLSESASICPVKDKHSPMFNLWTVCDSIKSLVGELESVRMQYDVIVIDRGIFDSMCWFQWLLDNEKMDHAMKETMDRFLSMEELVSCIDIVFVYKARPTVSIEREYASLLTDIPGSIMNEEVLGEYLKAVENTIEVVKEKKCFREIKTIETSDKNQDDVGKEITKTTLRILKEMFEERIGFIKMPADIKHRFMVNGWMNYDEFKNLGGLQLDIAFQQRSILESDYQKVQLVPIAVLKDRVTNQVLMVKKAAKATGENSREKDKILPYVGGHIRYEDVNGHNCDNFLKICKTALKREVREELGIAISLDNIVPDLIYVNDGSRSDLHMAICFLIAEKMDTLKVRMDSGELMSNRGKGKSGTFVEAELIVNEGNSWGEIILKKYFNVVSNKDQYSLFDNRG